MNGNMKVLTTYEYCKQEFMASKTTILQSILIF
jgi:hypothetical protein